MILWVVLLPMLAGVAAAVVAVNWVAATMSVSATVTLLPFDVVEASSRADALLTKIFFGTLITVAASLWFFAAAIRVALQEEVVTTRLQQLPQQPVPPSAHALQPEATRTDS